MKIPCYQILCCRCLLSLVRTVFALLFTKYYKGTFLHYTPYYLLRYTDAFFSKTGMYSAVTVAHSDCIKKLRYLIREVMAFALCLKTSSLVVVGVSLYANTLHCILKRMVLSNGVDQKCLFPVRQVFR